MITADQKNRQTFLAKHFRTESSPVHSYSFWAFKIQFNKICTLKWTLSNKIKSCNNAHTHIPKIIVWRVLYRVYIFIWYNIKIQRTEHMRTNRERASERASERAVHVTMVINTIDAYSIRICVQWANPSIRTRFIYIHIPFVK